MASKANFKRLVIYAAECAAAYFCGDGSAFLFFGFGGYCLEQGLCDGTLRASANPRQFSAVRHLDDSSAADFGCYFNDGNIIGLDDFSDYGRLLTQRMVFGRF